MTDECSKYESIFTFRTEKELLEHIKICPQCAKVQEKMDRVSELIQEVKPHYLKKQNKKRVRAAACIAFFLMLGVTTLTLAGMNSDITDTLMYGTTLSAEDLGFPVDSYGLISVE